MLRTFNATEGQELLRNVRMAQYARDSDVYKFKQLLESNGVDGSFAVTALRTLTERELPHYNDERGSASLELQLRAILAALAAVRGTIAQISRDTHQALHDCVSRLDDFCKRDQRIHDNPNVKFLMRRVNMDTLALKNDGTKTDVVLSVGLALGDGLLRIYGRDLMGAIDALQASSLDWSQARDTFMGIVHKVRTGSFRYGQTDLAEMNGYMEMRVLAQNLIQASQTTEAQRQANKMCEIQERPGTLIAFELLDAFQQQYISAADNTLAYQAGEVAINCLRKWDMRNDLRYKCLELLLCLESYLPCVSTTPSALSQAEDIARMRGFDFSKLRQTVTAKIQCDQRLQSRIMYDMFQQKAESFPESVSIASTLVASAPSRYTEPPASEQTTQKFADGSVYIGSLRDGKFHGQGVLTGLDGERRAGTFEDGFMEGQGQVDYANGHRREGTFRGGRHREGILTLPTGHRHEGCFDSNGDLMTGKITLPDGAIQKGSFVEGKLTGEGELVYANGQRRKGYFTEGFLNGLGKVWYENGDIREGTFAGGRHRDGILTLPSGDWHEGSFNLDGKLEKGKLTTSNGDVQVGSFVDGKLTGQGEISFVGKQRRTGFFKDGFLNGQGKVWYENGDIREGIFVGGRHQQGTLTLPTGHRHQGDFDRDGHLIKGSVIPPDGQ